MIKYVLFPGYVRSINDGDRHYIGTQVLAKLYGVSLSECLIIDIERPETFLGVDIKGLIRLGPRRDGDYDLPHK